MEIRVVLCRETGKQDIVQIPVGALLGVRVIQYGDSTFVYRCANAFADPVFEECQAPLVLKAPLDVGRKFFGQKGKDA